VLFLQIPAVLLRPPIFLQTDPNLDADGFSPNSFLSFFKKKSVKTRISAIAARTEENHVFKLVPLKSSVRGTLLFDTEVKW
jgi:hypothetical protein